MNKKIKVLMVTGVYFPEINGAVLQCRQIIKNLAHLINFSILTGSKNKNNYYDQSIEGITIDRISSIKKNNLFYLLNLIMLTISFTKRINNIDLVHIHGFSKRNAYIIFLSLIYKRKVILKMTSYGVDDPCSIKNKSFIEWLIFKKCHAYIGISPIFLESFVKAKLTIEKYNFIPNGVDIEKFLPVSIEKKNYLKNKYNFFKEDKIILFIGHFSQEKRPYLLYHSWLNLINSNNITNLIMIGRTKDHYEVDDDIIQEIIVDARKRGVLDYIHIIEDSNQINEYMQIADVFVLTSIREGMPNVLVEAMACAIPCVASNLPGITDWIIKDGVNGYLFDGNDSCLLTEKIKNALIKNNVGNEARNFIKNNFTSINSSNLVHELYINQINDYKINI
jgi:glycosyltransferase involved in cell wall biosynthesis